MNTQRISEMSGKVINNTPEAVKDHPAITALLSLGVGFQLHRWISFDGRLHSACRRIDSWQSDVRSSKGKRTSGRNTTHRPGENQADTA